VGANNAMRSNPAHAPIQNKIKAQRYVRGHKMLVMQNPKIPNAIIHHNLTAANDAIKTLAMHPASAIKK